MIQGLAVDGSIEVVGGSSKTDALHQIGFKVNWVLATPQSSAPAKYLSNPTHNHRREKPVEAWFENKHLSKMNDYRTKQIAVGLYSRGG